MGELETLLRGASVLSGVDAVSLVARDRRPELVEARAAVAVVLRRRGWKVEAIGAGLGGRSHATAARARALVARRPRAAVWAAALDVLAGSVCGSVAA